MGAKAPLHYFQKKLLLGLRPRFIIPKKFPIKSMARFIITKNISHGGYGSA